MGWERLGGKGLYGRGDDQEGEAYMGGGSLGGRGLYGWEEIRRARLIWEGGDQEGGDQEGEAYMGRVLQCILWYMIKPVVGPARLGAKIPTA